MVLISEKAENNLERRQLLWITVQVATTVSLKAMMKA